MGRTVSISIWNKTEGDFNYEKSEIDHGKFIKEPPKLILRDQICPFIVGNRTGAKIGPKGKVYYKTTQNGQTFEIIFTWDHPFNASDSKYSCYSEEPKGKIKATLSPNHPTGHHQAITWTVELSSKGE